MFALPTSDALRCAGGPDVRCAKSDPFMSADVVEPTFQWLCSALRLAAAVPRAGLRWPPHRSAARLACHFQRSSKLQVHAYLLSMHQLRIIVNCVAWWSEIIGAANGWLLLWLVETNGGPHFEKSRSRKMRPSWSYFLIRFLVRYSFQISIQCR